MKKPTDEYTQKLLLNPMHGLALQIPPDYDAKQSVTGKAPNICPRIYTDASGREKSVMCNKWTCPTCAPNLQTALQAAAITEVSTWNNPLTVALRTDPPSGTDISKIWKRFRTRFRGMKFIGIIDHTGAGAHIHAIISGCDVAAAENAWKSCGGGDCLIERTQYIAQSLDYILRQRRARGQRILKSMHWTQRKTWKRIANIVADVADASATIAGKMAAAAIRGISASQPEKDPAHLPQDERTAGSPTSNTAEIYSRLNRILELLREEYPDGLDIQITIKP